ncbi:site-specific integrase [Bosea sp. MMO-172]|uniref:site-specific integrase n=1 Tax=Bosea sp. MMO-172 TaxID=3127885 RepID=UPI00301AC41C
MALATYIHKRAGSARYYVRVTVPSDLAKDYGRTEIWKSLGTASPAEAKVKAPGVYMAIQDEFAARRRAREIVEGDVAAIAWKHYSELVENDERFREQNLTDDQLDQLWREMEAEFGEYDIGAYKAFAEIRDRIETYRQLRERSRSLLTSGDLNKRLEAVAESVDEHVAAYRAVLPKTSPVYRKVAEAVARAEIEGLKRADERDVMDWGGVPTDPLIKRAEKPKAAPAGSRLMDFYKLFIMQRGNGLKDDTRDQNEGIVQLFAEFFGEDMPLDKLERKHVAGWRDQLYLLPAKAKQIRELKGLKFKEIITKNKELGRKTIDPKTINKYLSAVGPFLKWLLSNGHIPAPVISDEMYIRLDRERKRDPFTDDQVTALFASPLFRGCLSDDVEHKPGNVIIRDWRYWIPLVALYSGMRLGEIAQLLTNDVREIEGTWVMYVTDEGDPDKTLKTVGSRRVVPVHSELVALGFLDYHKARTKGEGARLFPEIEPDARGFMSGVPSKFLNVYLDRIGVKTERLAVHSFRHLFTDRLRNAGHLDHEFGFVLGHGDRFKSTTGRYGSLPQGTVEHRKRLVEEVSFMDLGLKGLMPSTSGEPGNE